MMYAGSTGWIQPTRMTPEATPFFSLAGGSLGDLSCIITEKPLNGRLEGLGCHGDRTCQKCAGANLDMNRRQDLAGIRGGSPSLSVEGAVAKMLLNDINSAFGVTPGMSYGASMAAVYALPEGVQKNYLQTIGIAIGNELAATVADYSPEDNAAAADSLARMYAQLEEFLAGSLAQDTIAHGGLTAAEHQQNLQRYEAAKSQAALDRAKFCGNPVNKALIPELWADYDCRLPLPSFGTTALLVGGVLLLGLYGRVRG